MNQDGRKPPQEPDNPYAYRPGELPPEQHPNAYGTPPQASSPQGPYPQGPYPQGPYPQGAAHGHPGGHPQGGPGAGGYPPGPHLGALPPPVVLADGMPLASVWKRLAAYVVDYLIMMLVLIPVVLIFVMLQFGGVFVLFGANPAAGYADRDAAWGLFTLGVWALYLVIFGLSFGLTYYMYIHRVRQVGASPGKQIVGLRIRSVVADGQLTWGQAWGRWGFMYLFSMVTFGIGALIDVLWCLWDPRRQCLHDKAVGTVVIDHALPVCPPDHPETQRAAMLPVARGWVADGPSPVTPPDYPRPGFFG